MIGLTVRCSCKLGDHGDSPGMNVSVNRLNHMYPTLRGDSIGVDRCMVPLLETLWARGIWTSGCCCGHGKNLASVCVFPDQEAAMIELGFVRDPMIPHGGCFIVEIEKDGAE